ncbi:MAG: YwaF family protein [Oscillospiraceae bacterium]|nr:YwaF family protein [Oscillospiraceae bacterium]
MSFWQNVLRILDADMTEPQPYGAFHLIVFALSIAIGIGLGLWHKKNGTPERVRHIVLGTSVLVILLEVYKLINFSFSYENGITFDFAWDAFPWQFCSTPMYVGLLAGLTRKGKLHESLCAYLATYALFAGLIVMIIPTSIFIETIGINIQTSICHGSMISIAIYLMYSGYVKVENKTILKAIPVFAVAILVAMILNEVGHMTGLTEEHYFNMFYFSRHEDPHLPIYSLVQPLVPYPVSLIIYIGGFTLAAYLMLVGAMGIRKLSALPKHKTAIVK